MSRQNRFLLFMVIAVAVMGFLDAHLFGKGKSISPLSLVYYLVMAGLIHGWCKAHSAARCIVPPLGSVPLAAFLAPIGIPIYFLRTMPLGAASFASIKAACFYAALACVYVLSGYPDGFPAA